MSEDECDVLNKDESCNMQGENVKIFQELRSTNLLLGKLIGAMRQTERCVEALEEKASTSASSTSSSTSGASERKTKAIPLQIRVITCVLMVHVCVGHGNSTTQYYLCILSVVKIADHLKGWQGFNTPPCIYSTKLFT